MSKQPSDPGKGLAGETRELLSVFLPDWARKIIEKRLTRAFLTVVAALVVIPVLIPLLAAIWLKALGGFDNGVAKAMRNAYIDAISEGFAIEEVASRSNIRLDYLQLFEYDLRSRTPAKELMISIHPRQKAAIDIRNVAFTADSVGCTLPEGDLELVSVLLSDQPVTVIHQADINKRIDIGTRWWTKTINEVPDEDQGMQRLSFKLSEAVRHSCGRVHLEGSIRVFKDLTLLRQADRSL